MKTQNDNTQFFNIIVKKFFDNLVIADMFDESIYSTTKLVFVDSENNHYVYDINISETNLTNTDKQIVEQIVDQIENQNIDNQVVDNQVVDNQIIDDQVVDNQVVDDQVVDIQIENQNIDNQIENQIENQNVENQNVDNQAIDNQVVDNQVVDNQNNNKNIEHNVMCPDCKQVFTDIISRDDHILIFHDNIFYDEYICEKCSQEYNTYNDLENHYKTCKIPQITSVNISKQILDQINNILNRENQENPENKINQTGQMNSIHNILKK